MTSRTCLGVVFTLSLSLHSAGAARSADDLQPTPNAALPVAGAPRAPFELSSPRRTSATLTGDAELIHALHSGAARPLGLAAADFDRDGLSDVAAFYAHGREGVVVVHRATRDAYDPYAPEAIRRRGAAPPEATQAFLGEARVLAAPLAPDFFGAGDFDNDGCADLLVASTRGSSFAVLLGDGAGGFGEPREIALGGTLVALAVGTVNRDDGIADVVAMLQTSDGPRLRVYESPEGALRATPETIVLPARATDLRIGELQDDANGDIVLLAGRELWIVHGRDRHLGETAERAAAVAPARVERRRLEVEGRSLALGRFTHEALTDIVVIDAAGTPYRTPGHRDAALEPLASGGATRGAVATQLSAGRRQGLLMLGDLPAADLRTSAGFDVRLDLEDAAVAALPMHLNSDALEDLVLLDASGRGQLTTSQRLLSTTFFVTNTSDSGAGSLRQAILDANATAGPDNIWFGIPGSPPFVIPITSALPAIVDTVMIDARTQPGWSGSPVVFVNGLSSGAPCGLCFSGGGADASAVLGLGIFGVPGDGIRFDDTWVSVVDQCYLGTDPSGSFALANGTGVSVLRSQVDAIGRTFGNLISGNTGSGVFLRGGPSGSYFASTDVPKPIPDLATVTSTLDVPLAAIVEDVNVTLDITHTYDSDLVLTLRSPTGITVTLAAAVGGLGDNFTATTFDDEAVTPIGAGFPPFSGSYIPAVPLSGLDGGPVDGTWTLDVSDTVGGDVGTLNSWSLSFQNRTSRNVVLRNKIGTNAGGSAGVPNFRGVFLSDEASDTIGGPGIDGNLISGNVESGVWVEGSLSRGHRIQGNLVGTNAAGSSPVPNGQSGIVLSGGVSGTSVGGTAAGAGNVTSGHANYGIMAQSVQGNRYEGNYSGTDISGSFPVPNGYGFRGIAAVGEMIGGSVPGARNLFSGNSWFGVSLDPFGVGGSNIVVGNFIGTNSAGTGALGNGIGIALLDDYDRLTDNVISGNSGEGVYISSTGHLFHGNVVGLNASASARIPNGTGVRIAGGKGCEIGSFWGTPNVIAGNLGDGVRIEGPALMGPVTQPSSDVPKAIPDLASVTSALFVSVDAVLIDLDVRLDIVHTWDADLLVTLIDPSGLRIPLTQNRGGSGDNYSGTLFDDEAPTPISAGAPPFAGSFRPEQPLTYLDGRGTWGTWTLEVTDQALGDVGTLNSWQVTLIYAQSLNNSIDSNFIGSNAGGAPGLENSGPGVHLVDAASNTVGDLLGNRIAGNAWGVLAEGLLSSGNLIRNNTIGAALALNIAGGIAIDVGLGNVVSGNIIRRNGGPGTWVVSGYNNSIRSNTMEGNAGLGIDLNPPFFVNPNDAGDPDVGPNDLQNYPTITSLIPLGPNNQINGTLETEPNRNYEIDFYSSAVADPSGHGEGESYLGSTLVNSGPTGIVPFTFLAPAGVGFYSATATGPGGSTSEHSGAFALPQEVPDTARASRSGANVKLTYTPACGASDHAVFWGLSPIVGAPSWSNAQCGFGAWGEIVFDPGAPSSGRFHYWVVVGQTFSLEGSYGQLSTGAERPEAVGLGVCERPQSLVGPCP